MPTVAAAVWCQFPLRRPPLQFTNCIHVEINLTLWAILWSQSGICIPTYEWLWDSECKGFSQSLTSQGQDLYSGVLTLNPVLLLLQTFRQIGGSEPIWAEDVGKWRGVIYEITKFKIQKTWSHCWELDSGLSHGRSVWGSSLKIEA